MIASYVPILFVGKRLTFLIQSSKYIKKVKPQQIAEALLTPYEKYTHYKFTQLREQELSQNVNLLTEKLERNVKTNEQ